VNRREFVKMSSAFPAAAVSASLVLKKAGKEPIECAVSVLKVQPGDTLILSVPGVITVDASHCIKETVEGVFEGRVKAIVLADGITLDGVIRG